MVEQLLIVAVVAFVGCTLILPEIVRLAIALRLTDRPDRDRKLHAAPVPLGGGVAIWISLAVAIYIGCFAGGESRLILRSEQQELLGLFVASVAIVGVGLVDDLFLLRGRQKLVGQLFAATAFASMGLTIQRVGLFGFEMSLGLWALPCTVAWLVVAMNAINLLDGIDGSAATTSLVLCLGVAVVALMNGQNSSAFLAVGLAGSLTAFLRCNLPPARVYLGDAGSMLLGLVLGATAIAASRDSAGTSSMAVALSLWTLPLFDALAALLRRKLTGRSVFTGDRAHVHHRLVLRTGSPRGALLLLLLATTTTAGGAILGASLGSDLLPIAVDLAVVAGFVMTRTFGHVEWTLLLRFVRRGMKRRAPRRAMSPLSVARYEAQPARANA